MALISCPFCGKQVSDKAVNCPHCGKDLSGQEPEEKKRTCEECGAEIPDSVSVCPNCGCPLEEVASNTDSDSEKNADNKDSVEESRTNVEAEDGSSNQEIKDVEEDQNSGIVSAQKGKKKIGIVIGVIAVLLIGGIAAFLGTAKSRAYSKATQLYNAEKFKEAKEKFLAAKDYKDAKEKVSDCEYQLSTDGQFMRALSKGLMERWDQIDKDNEDGSSADEAKCNAKYCDIELSHLEEFEKASFDNASLAEDAKTYIDLLRKAKEATEFYTIDWSKYSTDWGNVYSKRTQLLKKMIDDYDLAVDDKHQDSLDDLVRDAGAAAKLDAAKEEIAEMAKKFKISVTKDEYGYKTYSMHMENTTEYTFEYFSVDFNLLDKDGNIVDTGNANQVTNWKPGQKADVDAWISNNQEIDPADYTISYTPHYSTADGTIYN